MTLAAMFTASLICMGVAHSGEPSLRFPNPSDATSLPLRAAADGTVRVIVGLRLAAGKFTPEGALSDRAAVDGQRREISLARDTLAASLGGQARAYATWHSLPYVALEVDAAGLAALAVSDLVTTISADALSRPSLDSAMPHIGADVTYAAGFGGAGQTIVIVDTGIDANHPFFGGRVVAEGCFSASGGGVSLCPNGTMSQTGAGAADALTTQCLFEGSSLCDHGVHVAGIAAGRDPGSPTPAPGGINGVAPDANIVALQVFTRFNSSTDCSPDPAPCVASWTSDQMSAIDYVNSTLRLSWTIAAANMSLGGGMFTGACDGEPLKAAIDNLLSNGIATVIASGNDGWTDALGAPGCISTAVTVGSTNDPSDAVSSFTNMNGVVDLLAPGRSITSSVPDDVYATFSGTSMATPVVAGALAVLKDASSGASVGDLVGALQTTGVSVTDTRAANPPGAATGISKNRVQLDAAVQYVQPGICGNGTIEFGEQCDTTDPGACPTGICDPDCTCEDPVCGNDIVEAGESCDGLSDAACPGLCGAPGGAGECLCPDPDDCPSARVIPAFPYADTHDTTTATIDAGDPVLCGGMTQPQGHSVWYQFVAPAGGEVTVDTFGSDYDTVLAGLQGSCGSVSVLACNDDFSGLQSQIGFPVTAAESYLIEVTDYNVAAGGSLVLHAYFAPDCGNGSLDGDEDCDDGNSLDGDCCASDCTFEPSGSPCDDFDLCSEVDSCDGAGSCDGSVVTDCTDGDLCTQDTCLGGGSCANDFVPAVMCKTSAKAALQVKDDANDTKDQVKWRWQKGAFVTDLELGSPAVDTDYTLCVYDETASVPALYMGRTIPGGSAAWVDKGPGKGVQYKDKLGTSDGFVKVQVRPGSSGKSKAQVRLKGAGLALPGPNAGSEYFDQDPRITVQLINELGVCWTSEFTPAGTKRNDSSQFNAKAP